MRHSTFVTIKVTYHHYLAGSPGELLSIEAMYETMKAGHLEGMHLNAQNEVVVAYEEDQPVAILVFEEYDDGGELWILLGYCRPEHRGEGHYRACVEKLKSIAADRGYSRIHTASHPDNVAAIKSIEARGGTVQYIGYVFPI